MSSVYQTIVECSCEFINDYLSTRSYVCGYTPTSADKILFNTFSKNKKVSDFVHILRWFKHIESYSVNERNNFPQYDYDNLRTLITYYLDMQVNNTLFCLEVLNEWLPVLWRNMIRKGLHAVYFWSRPVGRTGCFSTSSAFFKELPQVSDAKISCFGTAIQLNENNSCSEIAVLGKT